MSFNKKGSYMISSDQKSLKEMVIYILNKTKGLDYYRVFKVLYFAEMEHLATWGARMIEDDFCALSHGPVPTQLYNAVKELDAPKSDLAILMSEDVEIAGLDAPNVLLAKREADMSRISLACKEALDKSIEENVALSFFALRRKSHDKAWEAAFNRVDKRMSLTEIAKVKGIDECTLAYLKEQLEIQAALA